MVRQNILTCTSVKFYCLKDEDGFFEWIKRIGCVGTFSAAGRELYLHIAADEIHDQDLDDLIGLKVFGEE